MNIIPEIKGMIRKKDADFVVDKDTSVLRKTPAIDAALVEILREEMENISGIKMPAENRGNSDGNKKIILMLNSGGDDGLGAEGYLLNVDKNKITVAANNSRGIFYGIQTLLQSAGKRNGKFLVPGVKIRDWPSLKIRGVHCSPSGLTVGEIKKSIKILGTYKINTLLMDFYGKFKYKKHQAIGDPGALNAGQIKEIVSYAKKCYVDVIPSVNAYSHFDWVLKHKEYARLGEGYANIQGKRSLIQLCPLNKGSLKLITDLYKEIIPLFESDYFHIGCDETYWLGSCKKCGEEEKKTGKTGLFSKFVTRLVGILAAYKKTPIFWDDMALQYPELAKSLPKRLVYADWHYGPEYGDKRYPSLEYIKNKGAEAIACPAATSSIGDFNFQNVREFIHEACKLSVLGEITTQWNKAFGLHWQVIVLSAECAWSGKAVRQKDFDRKFVYSFYGVDSRELAEAPYALQLRKGMLGIDLSEKKTFFSGGDVVKLKKLGTQASATLHLLKKQRLVVKKHAEYLTPLILQAKGYLGRIKMLLASNQPSVLPAGTIAMPKESLNKEHPEENGECSLIKKETPWQHTLLVLKNGTVETTIVPEIGGRIFGTFFDGQYEAGIKDTAWLLHPESGGGREWGGFDDKLYYNGRLYHHIGYRCGYHKYQYDILHNSRKKSEVKVRLETALVRVERIMTMASGKPGLDVDISYTNLYQKAWVAIHAHPNMKLNDNANYAVHLLAPTTHGILNEPLLCLHNNGIITDFSEGWLGVLDSLTKKAIIICFDPKQVKDFLVCYGNNSFGLEPWGLKKELETGQSVRMHLGYYLLDNPSAVHFLPLDENQKNKIRQLFGQGTCL